MNLEEALEQVRYWLDDCGEDDRKEFPEDAAQVVINRLTEIFNEMRPKPSLRPKWAPGRRVIHLLSSRVGTIRQPPDGETSDYCVFVEWEGGERDWVNKDEVKRL